MENFIVKKVDACKIKKQMWQMPNEKDTHKLLKKRI